jgi:hypothetical protein
MAAGAGDRHARQARLQGVGAEGQARIARAVVEVPLDGLAGEVAVRYLAGAGVGAVRVSTSELAQVATEVEGRVRVEVDGSSAAAAGASDEPFGVEHPAAAAVACGARMALRALREVVEGDS